MILKKAKDRLIFLEANKIKLLGLLFDKKEEIETQITYMTNIHDEIIQKQKDIIISLTK